MYAFGRIRIVVCGLANFRGAAITTRSVCRVGFWLKGENINTDFGKAPANCHVVSLTQPL